MFVARRVTLLVLASALVACSAVQSRPRAVVSATAHPPAWNDPRFDAELSAYAYPFEVRFAELRAQRQTVRMAYMDVPSDKPNGHTVVTVSPVAFTTRQNPDGSATVVVGDIDQVTSMHWEVALTLRPGQARLER